MITSRTPFALLALLAAVHAAGQTPTYAPAIDALVKDQIDKGRCPSIAIAIVRNGKVEYAKGYGLADVENEVPSSPDTVYRLGSVTKQFTATMIMQLVKEGKVDLDASLQKYVEGTPKTWEKVTVRNLLNHTGGLKNYTSIPGLFADGIMKPVKPAGILKTVEKDPLDFEPGSKWSYSNTGYEVLGMIIEKVDGRSYAESLKARILDPLDMKATYFTSELAIVKHRASGYSMTKDGLRHSTYLNMDWPYAAGSMESTVLDLAKWDAALYGEKILPQSVLKEMWTGTKLADKSTKTYGYGWGLGKVNGVELVEHSGGINGFTTDLRRAPAKGVTVIVLTNSDSGNPSLIAQKAMGIAEPTLAEAVVPPTVDGDTKADDFAKAFLESLIAGTMDRKLLTTEASKMLTPEMAKDIREELNGFGPLKEFKLVDVKPADKGKRRTYHVLLGKENARFTIQIEGGLVASIGLRPED